jgi:hypothetical protein
MTHTCEVMEALINQAIEVGRARQIADDADVEVEFETNRLTDLVDRAMAVIPCNIEVGIIH